LSENLTKAVHYGKERHQELTETTQRATILQTKITLNGLGLHY